MLQCETVHQRSVCENTEKERGVNNFAPGYRDGRFLTERLNTMTIGLLFWVIMIIGFVFGLYTNKAAPIPWVSNNLVTWILLALLGWQVFGPALHK